MQIEAYGSQLLLVISSLMLHLLYDQDFFYSSLSFWSSNTMKNKIAGSENSKKWFIFAISWKEI